MTRVRGRGRPHAGFSKRVDAAALFRALQALGCGYREGELAVEALLGVERRELARGIAQPISAGNEESMVLLAVFTLVKYRHVIRDRFQSPNTGAAAAVESLPDAARGWLCDTLPELCTG